MSVELFFFNAFQNIFSKCFSFIYDHIWKRAELQVSSSVESPVRQFLVIILIGAAENNFNILRCILFLGWFCCPTGFFWHITYFLSYLFFSSAVTVKTWWICSCCWYYTTKGLRIHFYIQWKNGKIGRIKCVRNGVAHIFIWWTWQILHGCLKHSPQNCTTYFFSYSKMCFLCAFPDIFQSLFHDEANSRICYAFKSLKYTGMMISRNSVIYFHTLCETHHISISLIFCWS